jgi:hypothetical protein
MSLIAMCSHAKKLYGTFETAANKVITVRPDKKSYSLLPKIIVSSLVQLQTKVSTPSVPVHKSHYKNQIIPKLPTSFSVFCHEKRN